MAEKVNVVAKYSGDPFVDETRSGEVDEFVEDVIALKERMDGILVVSVGGGAGNRGAEVANDGMNRVRADQNGMLASIANAATLASKVAEQTKVYGFKTLPAHLVTAELGEPEGDRINRALTFESAGTAVLKASKEPGIIIAGGGTGFGRVSTDTGAVLWALNLANPESGYETVVLKGTSVDGVYDKDPRKYDDARKYDHMNYDFCISNDIRVMDPIAWPMLRGVNITTRVFANGKGNLLRAYNGEIGSLLNNAPMAQGYRA